VHSKKIKNRVISRFARKEKSTDFRLIMRLKI
jgi:hypothetical protein